MTVATLTRSFSGGEITPELFGRVDLEKFQNGLKTCRNFEVLPHGPAANRTGWEYVLETKFSNQKSVLLPFIFNTSQAYQLEFGNNYLRFHTQDGTVLESPVNITGITNANPAVVTAPAHGYTTGQWVWFSGIAGMVQLNGRYAVVTVLTANTYSIAYMDGVGINTTAYGAYTAGGTSARVYEIATPYASADLFDLHITQSADVLTITHQNYDKMLLKRLGAANFTLTVETVVPTQQPPTGVSATPTPGGVVTFTYNYVVTAVASGTLEESVQSTSVGTCTNNITLAGNSNLVQWTNIAGAIRYNVYKQINGLWGFIAQGTDGTIGVIDNNITPDVKQSPPIANDPISTATNYPGAVGYFQGRKVFAGSLTNPQSLYATQSGTESNMCYSIPTQDSDSITVKLSARRADTIRHVVALGDLILLTSGGEWMIPGNVVITPSNLSYTPQDYVGASNVPPIVTSSAVLYAADRGGRVREMKFVWQQQGYRSADLSIMAPHLFDTFTLAQCAYSRAPYSMAWWVRSDGTLLGLTYVQEQQISAWHHHDTAGTFESVCCTPEGTEDVVYAIINRTINGRTVRYIERQRTRNFGSLPFAFFVDAGLTAVFNNPVTTITGFYHLEGTPVSVLADGAVIPSVVVTNGSIVLTQAASIVSVGLGYVSDLETLPLSYQAPADGQGVRKNIDEVVLRVNASSGINVGPTLDAVNLSPWPQRTIEPYGSPPNLITDAIPVKITPSWNQSGGISIRQSDPLPITILSMTLKAAPGG